MGLDLDLNKHQFRPAGVDDIVLHAGLAIIGHALGQLRPALNPIGRNQQQIAIGLRHHHIIPLMHMGHRFGPRRETVFGYPNPVVVFLHRANGCLALYPT